MILFLIAHISGWRDLTSILNGTSGSTTMSWRESAFLGVLYVIVYLGFVVVAPILVLAAGILKVWRRLIGAKGVDESGKQSNELTGKAFQPQIDADEHR